MYLPSLSLNKGLQAVYRLLVGRVKICIAKVNDYKCKLDYSYMLVCSLGYKTWYILIFGAKIIAK